MKNIVSVYKLKYAYDDNEIFKEFNLDIEENKWITIIGKNGSGKSTLARLLNNKKNINANKWELLSLPIDIKKEAINNLKQDKTLINLLNLNKIINKTISNLSNSDKIVLKIGILLHDKIDLIILDSIIDVLDDEKKENTIKTLKKYHEKGLTIINLTSDIEQSLLGSDILLLEDGKIILNTSKDNFFNDEKLLSKYHVALPFIVDLSIKLKYYGLIDKIYLDMKELCDAVWK